MEEGSDGPNKKGSWSIVNYFLGAVCFCLVLYFMNMVRGNKEPGKGGGGWGSNSRKAGLFGRDKKSSMGGRSSGKGRSSGRR